MFGRKLSEILQSSFVFKIVRSVKKFLRLACQPPLLSPPIQKMVSG
jgi:hypothetical protein